MGRPKIDLVGQKFNHLTVISFDHSEGIHRFWLCRCDCGVEKVIRASGFKYGNIKSCGCKKQEVCREAATIHGASTTPAYKSWSSMKSRCLNSNTPQYHNYGGRGITVCERWLKFENFLEDMGQPPTDKHELDRINNNGPYSPDNCRWATRKQNNRNRRNNRNIDFNGKVQCLLDWANEYGLHQSVLWARLNRGWPIEKALTTPVAA